jgi:hypothetical protein
VVAVAPVTDPPPVATAKVTVAPAFACELLVTMTVGAVATACATVALCPSPADIESAIVAGSRLFDPLLVLQPAVATAASATTAI